MKAVWGIGTLMSVFLQADPVNRQIEDITRYQEQKKIYEEQTKERQSAKPIYTPLGKITLQEDATDSERCILIETIDLEDITLIDKKELDTLILPYLHRCNTMNEINNLVKKINNLYIEKAYITSRAYIKPQDISKGHLVISAMEGKIESVAGEGLSTALVFPFIEDNYLNLRDLEVGVEQLNRLQSMRATMSINPGSKIGYSRILMKGEKVGSSLHGSLGVNNYGTSKSGKYQFNASFGWDNPLGINDLLTINLNTTNKQDKENNALGDSIHYALPIGRSYLELSYFNFKYNQIVNGLNVDYLSEGEIETYQAKLEYKLFHTKEQRGKFDLSLLRKKNDNYLAGVYLDSSSNRLTIMQLAYTHNYIGDDSGGYLTLKYHRGFDWFNAGSGSHAKPVFNKYTLDMNYNKKLNEAEVPVRYNFSFHGQYAKEGIIGTEQIGIGGPYSVRGFKNEGQLSGNKGFYIRNELSLHQALSKGSFNPYLALDYGRVSKNEQSYGGYIIGFAMGTRVNVSGWSLDLFRSLPLKDSNNVTYRPNGDEVYKDNDGFWGFNLSYRF